MDRAIVLLYLEEEQPSLPPQQQQHALLPCQQRLLSMQESLHMMVSGWCSDGWSWFVLCGLDSACIINMICYTGPVTLDLSATLHV